jgi:hypothetical protein
MENVHNTASKIIRRQVAEIDDLYTIIRSMDNVIIDNMNGMGDTSIDGLLKQLDIVHEYRCYSRLVLQKLQDNGSTF